MLIYWKFNTILKIKKHHPHPMRDMRTKNYASQMFIGHFSEMVLPL